MPRIRTIKPEFWDSPSTARAGLRARLFYIAMWNWADDHGIGTANPKHLIGFAFPNDDEVTVADFPRLRAEVAECFGTIWYEVDGRPYFCIPAWDDHQKNERRAQGRHPRPDQGECIVTEIPRISARTDGSSDPGTGEQGNRGTGEEEISSTSVEDRFDEFWTVYPRKVSKKNAKTRWDALMKRKVDPDRIISGAKIYARAVKNSAPEHIKHPDGWLNGERWEDAVPTESGAPARPLQPVPSYDPLPIRGTPEELDEIDRRNGIRR